MKPNTTEISELREKQYVIYHTATRVVRGVSVEMVDVDKTESVVEVNYKVDLSGGWKKLDDKNNLVEATAEEVKEAGYDWMFNEQKKEEAKVDLEASIADIVADPSVPTTIKDYFTALSKLK